METKIYRKLKKSTMKAIHLKMAYEVIDDQVVILEKKKEISLIIPY